jgi:hypothetical protein
MGEVCRRGELDLRVLFRKKQGITPGSIKTIILSQETSLQLQIISQLILVLAQITKQIQWYSVIFPVTIHVATRD